MDRDEEIREINHLIEITIDSADGYADAATQVKDAALRRLFEDRAASRRRIVSELQAHVRQHGGEPERKGSVTAGLHRTFLDLKTLVMDDRKAAIAEVERGEDAIRDRFQEALRKGLPTHIEGAIREHLSSITADHDRISAMKHAAE